MQDLFDAIRDNDSEAVGRLLDRNPSLLTAKSGDTSAILYAVYHGRPEIARLFVKRGANLSFAESVALGEIEKARQMLAKDASLRDAFSDDGYPSLGLAIFFRHPELARELIELGADVNAAARNQARVAPIHAAAATGDRDMVRLLLERGANPNAREQQGFMVIHTAALLGDIEMAKILLKHGADLQGASNDGKTAEQFAKEKGHQDFIDWLASNEK